MWVKDAEREMLSQERRRLVERLKTRKGRPREGLVLVEGVRAAREVLSAGPDVRFGVLSSRLNDSEVGRVLASDLADRGVDIALVDDADLSQLSDTEHPQGVLLICSEPRMDLTELQDRDPRTLLLLDGLQDPGNLGTLVRAAHAFAVGAVVVLDGSVDPWNAKAVRASAGASFHVDVVRADWTSCGPWLEDRGIGVLAADPAGDDVNALGPERPWALAVGNEGVGLRAEILVAARQRVGIPMPGRPNSLNAGVAGSILLYVLLTPGSVSS
jgi:TrmH family RNA methyltransferase